jgi:hypothetical protein
MVQAMRQAEVALQTINKSNLDKLPEVLATLETQTIRAARLADALADDYETLCVEQEVLREVFHEILGPNYEASMQAAQERVRRRREAASKQPEDEKST